MTKHLLYAFDLIELNGDDLRRERLKVGSDDAADMAANRHCL
jgi:hypothetical protein